MKRTAKITVRRDEDGQGVLDFLSRRFTYHDRAAWARLIAGGLVEHNGTPAAAEGVLREDDTLEYLVPDIPEPPVCFDYRVLHEDDELLVIDKPAGLPCHPAGRFFSHTLWAALRERGGIEKIEFVNRLDRETSGLVLVAKTIGAARDCRAQFTGRRVQKRYLAIVEGRFPGDQSATGRLVPDAGSRVIHKVLFEPLAADDPQRGASDWAETRFRVLETVGDLSLVEAQPLTGRRHQIRAVLLGLGFPVVGDKLYGRDEELFLRFVNHHLSAEDLARLRLPRQALHAAGLTLCHPRRGEPVVFESPMPGDMQGLLAEARRAVAAGSPAPGGG